MRFKFAEAAQFMAVIDHTYGQTRSGLMAPKLALRVAKLWMSQGDRGVRIEASDSDRSWTPHEFSVAMVR